MFDQILQYFSSIVLQVLVLLILILIGYFFTKAKILTDNAVKSMTDLILYLVTPCVIIKSMIREFNNTLLKDLLISFLIAVLCHIGFILLSKLFIKFKDKSSERVLQFSVIFTNCGFMSIPLQEALIGDIGVFYGSSYIAIFNIFIWSYGIFLMSGDKKTLSPKKLILNPGLIGVVLGVLIFLFSIPIPLPVKETITHMASLNTPLPMIIIGFHLANSNVLSGLKDKKSLYAIFLSLIVFPLIAITLIYLCGIKGDLLVSLAISVSAPAAAITTMFSSKFSQNTPLSANLVSISTFFSILTMPLMITFAKMIA